MSDEQQGAVDPLEVTRLTSTPVGFATRVLGLSLYWWQAEVLTWFEDTLKRIKGSLCTPNDSGKSSFCIPSLVLWALSVHPKARVVITTKDSKQLDNQIWPALTAHKAKFPTWRWIERAIYNEDGGFAIGFTTDEPGRAEGWHKLDDVEGPLFIIADESKSIPDEIFQAIDRCNFNALFLLSSPGLTEGRFWESQGSPDSQNVEADPEAKGFKHLRIGLSDCPHISQERIDDIRKSYPADHWFPRSTLDGLFTDADDDSWFIFNKAAVKRAMSKSEQPQFINGRQAAFLDFAAGRNENVMAHRVGNRINPLVCFKDRDPMAMVGRFIIEAENRSLRPSEIEGDESGMGIPILAKFREAKWPIIPIRNEWDAVDSTRYENLGAERWHETALKVNAGELILPDDPVLYKQLTSRKVKPTSDGKLGAESKKDMLKRGLESPDRGDAVCGVGSKDLSGAAIMLFDQTGLEKLEGKARPSRPERGALNLSGGEVQYDANAEAPWLQVWERPRQSARYLCVVNPAGYDEPLLDHVVLVLRDRGVDDKGKAYPARLAALVMRPLKTDARPLANVVGQLTKWYGHCFCVPITNDRGDVIDALQEAGVHIYFRENLETIRGSRREALEFGWETDDYTRSHWIGALAEAVRLDQLEVEDMETVMQMYQLNASNAKMMKNAEAVGVGLKLMNYASEYAAPAHSIFTVPEHQSEINESMIS